MKIPAMTVLVLLPALILAGLARSVYRRGAFTEIASWWRSASRPMKAVSILFATIAIWYDAFGYNRRSEVTNAYVSGTATAYGYDEIGNSSRYTANCLNQYTDFTYDADGNMLTDGLFSFAYDGAGRLKTVASNGVVIVANDYDSKSRRVRKTTPEYEAVYFYDDWNLVEERIAWTNGTSTLFRYYWGKDTSESLQGAGGVGGLLYMTVDEAVYMPCYDSNGNITCYLDETGAVVAAYVYDAFGNTVSATGEYAGIFRHRFSTKYLDSETGLYYYGYRFYHPQLMRWLNRDPIEEDGGLNLYAFCKNTTFSTDSLGLYVEIIFEIEKKTLIAKDVDTLKEVALVQKVFSGNGKSCCVKQDQWKIAEGPLPIGRYLIGMAYVPANHRNDNGDYNWYRLYGSNNKGGYTYDNIPVTTPTGRTVYRGGFNLHTGRESDGCVTIWSDVERGENGYPHSSDYDKLKILLNSTKPLKYKGSNYAGWLR